MVHFYPHFKVLFKFAQLGMTLTKQTSLENKVATAKKLMEQNQTQLTAQQAIVDNLAFYERVEAEVNRAREQEIAPMHQKYQELSHRIQQADQMYGDQAAYTATYFSDLRN